MEIRSPGYYFWTSYQDEGSIARVTGHWERQQQDALIARNTEFSLRFFSHGGPVELGTRAFVRRPPSTVARLVDPQGSRAPTVRSRPFAISRRIDDDRFHNPWDEWGVWDDPPIGPVEPPEPPGGGGGGVGHAAVRVKLFAPGIADPVQTWDLPAAVDAGTRLVEFNPLGFPTPDAPIKRAGWW